MFNYLTTTKAIFMQNTTPFLLFSFDIATDIWHTKIFPSNSLAIKFNIAWRLGAAL